MMKINMTLTALLTALLLAACAPGTQDSEMTGSAEVDMTEDATTDMTDEMTGEMTGGSEDMTDMMDSDMTGGMTGDMMDSMTGGMSGEMTGGAGMDMSDTDMSGAGEDMTDSAADAEPPTGSLGVAPTPGGPFVNDRPDGISDAADARIVEVAAGGSFYLQLEYSDPSGISSLDVSLRNSAESGNLPTASFTVDEAALDSTCDDQLATVPTELNCTIKVDVATSAQNIAEGGEFAYVFRARVIDGAGNAALDNERGYVAIQ